MPFVEMRLPQSRKESRWHQDICVFLITIYTQIDEPHKVLDSKDCLVEKFEKY